MNRKLLWQFLLIIATGTVTLFYTIDYFASRTEANMSLLKQHDRDELTAWGRRAEALFYADNQAGLQNWLSQLQQQEKTHASVVEYSFHHIAGNTLKMNYHSQHGFGRSVDWPIHLNFLHNPLMEIPFKKGQISFLIWLPDRMMPGNYLPTIQLTLQVLIPFVLMALLAIFLYQHIMQPLLKLQKATREFSQGNLSVRALDLMGNRNDEFTALANTFDQMANRIGQQIVNQRQLIADLSHELRTPLTRLDIAVNRISESLAMEKNIKRVAHESTNIRRLVEDTLTLAWLDNEQPVMAKEDIDLVDLLDVIVSDAQFEFPSKKIKTYLPDSATLTHSNHIAVGQAIENIVRNAMRYTPEGKLVEIGLESEPHKYLIKIKDQGPGIPSEYLETIFQPFFRIDQSRQNNGTSFGLGLSLAKRQLHTVGGCVSAHNRRTGGLCMVISLPKPAI